MTPKIFERQRRSVRARPDDDFLMSEGARNVVEIIRGISRAVHRKVGICRKRFAARAYAIDREQFAQHECRGRIQVALQRMGTARSSLVDQHDIVIQVHAPEERAAGQSGGDLDDGLTRPTGQRIERRTGFACRCGNHDRPQCDGAPETLAAVFPNLHPTASGSHAVEVAAVEVRRRRRGSRPENGSAASDKRCKQDQRTAKHAARIRHEENGA